MREPCPWYRWSAVAFAAAGLAVAEPAAATTCNTQQIASMSVDEAAQLIWTHSDVIGLGYVSTVVTPEREQQFVDIAVPLKGEAGRYAYAPYRVGRTQWIGPESSRLDAGPGQIVLVTLARGERGYVTPGCRAQLLAGREGPILRRLAILSREPRHPR